MTNEQMNQLINKMTQEQKTEFINKVTSDQYVDFMKEMMDKLNIFMEVFIGVIGIMFAVFAIYQFGFRKEQIEKIKSDARETTLKEVAEKLKANSIEDFKNDTEKAILESTTMNAKEIDKLSEKLDELRKLQGFRFKYDLSNVRNHDNPFEELNRLIRIYNDYMISNTDSFDYFALYVGETIAITSDLFSSTKTKELDYLKVLMKSLSRIRKKISEPSPEFDTLKNWLNLKLDKQNQI